MAEAFTYCAHREKLKVIGKEDILEPLNRQALQIAKEVADESGALLAGDLSNTNAYEPDNSDSVCGVRQAFEEQDGWAVDADVDFIIGETFSWLGEASLALEIIKSTGKPAVITLAMHQEGMVREGLPMDEACRRLQEAGADVVGLNCSRGPATMLPPIERIRKSVACHVVALPVPYRTTPDQPTFQSLKDPACACLPEGRRFPVALDPFTCNRYEIAEFARAAYAMGVRYLGVCCGAGPHHVRALAEALGRHPPASRYSPTCRAIPISAPIPRSRPGTESTPRGYRPRCRIGGTTARRWMSARHCCGGRLGPGARLLIPAHRQRPLQPLQHHPLIHPPAHDPLDEIRRQHGSARPISSPGARSWSGARQALRSCLPDLPEKTRRKVVRKPWAQRTSTEAYHAECRACPVDNGRAGHSILNPSGYVLEPDRNTTGLRPAPDPPAVDVRDVRLPLLRRISD